MARVRAICRIACLPALLIPSHLAAELSVTLPSGEIVQIGYVEDSGASVRIELADKLRTVSQEVPAAVCHLHNEVDVADAEELLHDGADNFEALLMALLNGDESLGIMKAETRERTRREIQDIRESWFPINAAANAVLENHGDVESVALVYDHASELLEKTSHLLSELEGEYTNPVELLYSDAMLIEVSGRQAMLTQRLAYLACRVWSGSADAEYVDFLKTAMSQFNFAMDAMRNGAPNLGINPPPTPEIAAALEDIASDFEIIMAHLNTVVETQALDETSAAELYHLLGAKMYKIEDVAHMYGEYSKRIY